MSVFGCWTGSGAVSFPHYTLGQPHLPAHPNTPFLQVSHPPASTIFLNAARVSLSVVPLLLIISCSAHSAKHFFILFIQTLLFGGGARPEPVCQPDAMFPWPHGKSKSSPSPSVDAIHFYGSLLFTMPILHDTMAKTGRCAIIPPLSGGSLILWT